MSNADEQAFHATILASPDDDFPRLLYADWLEERGDARAELIRVQCELAQLAAADCPAPGSRHRSDGSVTRDSSEPSIGAHRGQAPPDARPSLNTRHQLLSARARQLIEQNYEDWLEEPLLLLGVHAARFQRGMVEELELDASLFLDQSELIFQRAPLVRRVSMRKSGRRLEQLVQSHHLTRLSALELPGDFLDTIDDRGAELLAGSGHLSSLTALGLPFNALSASGVRALAASTGLRNLTSLDLSGNRLGREGLRVLAAWPHLCELNALNLSRTRVTAHDLKLLGQSPYWRSTTLVTVEPNLVPPDEAVELQNWFGVRIARS